jgi:hypothetical protein
MLLTRIGMSKFMKLLHLTKSSLRRNLSIFSSLLSRERLGSSSRVKTSDSGLDKPPESVLYGVKAIYYLLQPYIKQPYISTKREWEYFQGLLKKTIPDVASELISLLMTFQIF